MNTLRFLIPMAALLATPGLALAQSNSTADTTEERASDPAARQALDVYARCVAEQKPSESLRVLSQDFRTTPYRTGLRMLSDDSGRGCARAVGRNYRMQSSGLLFAGAVAENLLEQGDAPVNARLAGSAAATVETYGPTDAVAQCLARSLPDQVNALFATTPGDSAEAAAAEPLMAALDPCSRAAGLDARIEATVPALRAMIATAALRLIANSERTDA